MTDTQATRREMVDIADDEIDLAQLWGILFSGKWVIVGITILTLICGALYLTTTTTTYRASALLQLIPQQPTIQYSGAVKNRISRMMATQLRVITSSNVLDDAATQIARGTDSHESGQLVHKLRVTQQDGSAGLVQLSLEGMQRNALAPTVNAVAEAYQAHVKEKKGQTLQPGIAQTLLPAQVRVINDADEATVANAPKVSLIVALSLVLGILIGCGIVLLRAALRRTIDNPRDIEQNFGLPVYAVIPHIKWLAKQTRGKQTIPLLARDYPNEVATEALRSLRTAVLHNHAQNGNNTIVFTAPTADTGNNLIAANLGYLLAQTDKKVVIVDADMRRGKLHHVDGRQGQPGLSDVLSGQAEYKATLNPIDNTSCHVMPSGATPPNAAELLTHANLQNLLNQLNMEYDHVLVVAPPVLTVTDAAVIAGTGADISTILVTRCGQNRGEEIEEAIKRIRQGGGHITGAVFNGLKKSHSKNAGGLGFYQYEYKSQAKS